MIFLRFCPGCGKLWIVRGPMREILSPYHSYWHAECWNASIDALDETWQNLRVPPEEKPK